MNVLEFGAYGDGIHDDHGPIQAALNQNEGLVTIPKGVYKVGSTLRIPSNTHLKVHREARLIFGDGAGVDSQSFLLTSRDHAAGDKNIHIEGGIWDGNNLNNPRGPDEPGSYTGALFNFINVANLTIKGLTIRDADAYFIRLGEVRDFEIADIRFEAPNIRPNQDGVHLGGYCENGVIRNLVGIDGSTNDDLVALNADDALQRAQNLDLKCGPIRNIQVSNLQANSCHTFVRLLSVRSEISAVSVENVIGGCRCMAINLDGCRECRVQLFDPDDPQFQDGVGNIRNVRIANLQVHKSDEQDATPLINIRSNVGKFVVENFQRVQAKDVNSTAPTINFSECRASKMILEGALVDPIQESDGVSVVQDGSQYQIDIAAQGVLRLSEGGFINLNINSVGAQHAVPLPQLS